MNEKCFFCVIAVGLELQAKASLNKPQEFSLVSLCWYTFIMCGIFVSICNTTDVLGDFSMSSGLRIILNSCVLTFVSIEFFCVLDLLNK